MFEKQRNSPDFIVFNMETVELMDPPGALLDKSRASSESIDSQQFHSLKPVNPYVFCVYIYIYIYLYVLHIFAYIYVYLFIYVYYYY